MKNILFLVLCFSIVCISSCTTETNPAEEEYKTEEFYITISTYCEAALVDQQKYEIPKATYDSLKNNLPDYCEEISFTTIDNNQVTGIYYGLGYHCTGKCFN